MDGFFSTRKVNSVYQLPENLSLKRLKKNFGVDFFSYLENFPIKKKDYYKV